MSDFLQILIVHNRYRYAGGEDSVVQNEKALLESHGHSVTIYEKDNTDLDNCSLLQKVLLPFRTIYSFTSAKEILKIIRKEHIDIVHVHNTLPLISFSAYYAAKKCNCTLVQTIHNFRFLCPNGLFYRNGHVCQDCTSSLLHSIQHSCYRNSRLQSVIVALNLWFHRKAKTFLLPDAYITLTEFNQQILTSLLPSNKIYVKPNFTEGPPMFTVSKERRFFLYASRLDCSKGILFLLEVFQKLPDQQLVIIGAGPEKDAVLAYIEKYQLSNILFLGYAEHGETISYLYHAKALIFPSQWYEGFPVIIAESLSVGTPIIGSNLGNTASIIENSKTGLLFQYNNVNDCIQKIHEFSSPSFPYQNMEENCRNTFHTKYSPETNYKQLMEIYTTAINSGSKP